MEGAQAKALYGLTINYTALSALVELLLERDTLSGEEVRSVLAANNALAFPDPYVQGFGWDENGTLTFPGMEEVWPGGPVACDRLHQTWRLIHAVILLC